MDYAEQHTKLLVVKMTEEDDEKFFCPDCGLSFSTSEEKHMEQYHRDKTPYGRGN